MSKRGAWIRAASVAAAVLVGASPAVAQDASLPGFERVDQRVSDIHSLSTSLRQLEPGLAQPSGFSDLYRMTDARGEEVYVRADGAVYAVFPRSVYASTPSGRAMAVVPPGTLFMIGEPPAAGAPPRVQALGRVTPSMPGPLDAGRIAGRLETRVDGGREAPAPRPAIDTMRTVPRTIANDPEYRRRRIAELLERAARGR